MMDLLSDILGTLGVAAGLISYFLVQKGVLSATGGTYLITNVIAPLLIIFSLLIHWNFPAFLLEAAWASISIYGIYKHLYLPRRHS